MGNYIKLFNNEQDQANFMNSADYKSPHVSCTTNGGSLKYCTVINLEPVDVGISGFYVANCNLGATHPMDLGSTFAGGEIAPKETYTGDNYKGGTADNLTKYNETDNKTELDREDDAATVILGEHGRLPTYSEFKNYIMYSSSNMTIQRNGAIPTDQDYLPYMKLINNTTGAYVIIPKSNYYLTSSIRSSSITAYRNMNSRGITNEVLRYMPSYIRPIYIP